MLQEEETFLPSEQNESIFSEPLKVEFSEPSNTRNLLRFQRRLISRVRKRQQLYDAKHELFNDIASKEKIWQKIAENLNENVDKCKNTWANIRCRYQKYVRRLRKFLLYKNTLRKRRPIMALETELLFLWRYIPQQSRAPNPYIKSKTKNINKPNNDEDDDDIVILDDDEPVVIVLDDDEKTEPETSVSAFKTTPEILKLLELIKSYPELYDCENRYFKDYRRKGIIWNAIANEANDKATKLMKLWIQWQTRFEWELEKNNNPITDTKNDIREVMSFLGPYIQKNPDTVYKQSLYLKNAWHEPIDHFKNIYTLIATLKRFPNVVRETESQISLPNKSFQYVKAWGDISAFKNGSAGQYETTWLILRLFYWELMNMRKDCYQLQDKWYFESIISDVYSGSLEKPIEATNYQLSATQTSLVSIGKNINNTSTTITSVTPRSSTVTTVSLAANTPVSASGIVPASSSSSSSPLPVKPTVSSGMSYPVSAPPITSSVQQMILPKIVSAKSLAPSVTAASQINNYTPLRSLQIMQVVMPSNAMTVVPANTNILTKQKDSNNKLMMNPKSIKISKTPQLPQASQQQQAPQPPLLSGPYPLPKISSVHTYAKTLGQPAMNTTVASASNFIPTLNSHLTVPQSKSMLPMTPTTLPMTMPLQMPQLPQLPEILRKAQLSQIPTLSPITTTTPPSTLTLRPVIEANTQPVIPTLPGVPVSTQFLPSFNISRTSTPPTSNNPVPQKTQQTASAVLQSLNRNEVMIELIATPNGNQLLVHGPPLSESYTLSMQKTSEFIRQIMALPLIHNKSCSQSSRVHAYWVYIASIFNMPSHVCRAVWNFLSENFNHFSQIAPMEELMMPFVTEAKAWETGTVLFKKFIENVTKKGWLMHEQKLPALMEKIGKQRILYQDLSKKTNVTARTNNNKITEIWKKLRLEFNIDDIEEIWIAFKSVFWQYMHELEMGFENHWPQGLWRAISKLHFLIIQRYHNREPFYYIVRNKFQEEVDRCSEIERKAYELPLIFSMNAINSSCSYEIDAYNLLVSIKRHSEIYLPTSTSEKEEAWNKVAKELKTNVPACRLAFQRAVRNYRIFMHRDPANRCRLNHRYYKNLHTIYRTVTSSQKISIKTPTELNQSVSDAPDPNDVIFPERMIFDITMDNCSPTLVLKNWANGIGNCTPVVQKNIPDKIHALFAKYKKLSKENGMEL